IGAFEAGEYRAIGAVAGTGEGERAVEAHVHRVRAIQQAALAETQRELARRPHRPHRVGARRADPDLEDVEDAESAHCSASDNSVALPPTAAVLTVTVCSVAKRCR